MAKTARQTVPLVDSNVSWLSANIRFIYLRFVERRLKYLSLFNPLKPNYAYRRRTRSLTSKVAFYIFIQQI